MYVSVQRAARRLGVSPVTIRRWTSTGFLPCTRTPGGHRRIATEDIDELARSIGDGNHLAARLARERELDTMVSTAIALGSRHQLPSLLAEIARQVTSVLDCHMCAISELDKAADSLLLLADYDDTGRRLPDGGPYPLKRFPYTRSVLDDRMPAVVYVDDPAADPAEVSQLQSDGGRTLLMVPLVYKESTIGLIEVVDRERRRRFTRQELRLARAIAGHASVALVHARQLENSRLESGRELARATAQLAAALPGVYAAAAPERLAALAEAVRAAFGAVSCVAVIGGAGAGAAGADNLDAASADPSPDVPARPSIVTAAAGGLAFTLTLPGEPPAGATELLELTAAALAPSFAPAVAGPAVT
jgi:excisionase family DNA binding protein